jgi:ABC-type Fe3+ transport system permease subunit
MATPSLVVASAFMFTSMLASFSIPLMIGGGEQPQMLMVDVYYRINYQDDLGTANALGMVSDLMAMAVAGYYLRSITVKGA